MLDSQIIAGGYSTGTGELSSAERYIPNGDLWVSASNMTFTSYNGEGFCWSDGSAIQIVQGNNSGANDGVTTYFNPADAWVADTDVGTQLSHAASHNNESYGYSLSGSPSTHAYKLDHAADSWSDLGTIMNYRFFTSAGWAGDPDSVYVVNGEDNTSSVQATTDVFHVLTETMTAGPVTDTASSGAGCVAEGFTGSASYVFRGTHGSGASQVLNVHNQAWHDGVESPSDISSPGRIGFSAPDSYIYRDGYNAQIHFPFGGYTTKNRGISTDRYQTQTGTSTPLNKHHLASKIDIISVNQLKEVAFDLYGQRHYPGEVEIK